MTAAEKLSVLKMDLQMLTAANDDYLTLLLQQAEKAIATEGIKVVEGDTECEMAVIQYAAYLFRKRAAEETAMPRHLRYMLNNILFSQKAGGSS